MDPTWSAFRDWSVEKFVPPSTSRRWLSGRPRGSKVHVPVADLRPRDEPLIVTKVPTFKGGESTRENQQTRELLEKLIQYYTIYNIYSIEVPCK